MFIIARLNKLFIILSVVKIYYYRYETKKIPEKKVIIYTFFKSTTLIIKL